MLTRIDCCNPVCVNCKTVEPVLHELAREKAGKLKILMIDIESGQYLVQRFNVEKTPAFIFFKNGGEMLRVIGAPKNNNDLINWINNLLDHNYY